MADQTAAADKFVTYCGLYCENCIQRTNVGPDAKKLQESLKRAGYEKFGHLIPDFPIFWRFLSEFSENGGCVGCVSGGGNPYCQIRKCAVEKGVLACVFCEAYPCEESKRMFVGYPMLEKDNQFLKEKGIDEWIFMQKKRRAQGYVYSDFIENQDE
ncbi:MAG: DUF3795 domain-containing protein [Methanimicrococcus sp.]|nr:DUF3795 domain-containing protein [Methanimicrococcus sp.]